MPGTLHVSGIWAEKIAPAMSVMRFALPFGGTLALTIMGSVFGNKFADAAAGALGGAVDVKAGGGGGRGGIDTQSLDYIADMPKAEQEVVRTAGKDAVMWAFISIMPILGVSLVTGLFLGNVWIKKKNKSSSLSSEKDEEEGENAGDEGGSEVIYVPYLWALLKVSFLFVIWEC